MVNFILSSFKKVMKQIAPTGIQIRNNPKQKIEYQVRAKRNYIQIENK